MHPYFTDDTVTLWHGDALEILTGLPDQSVDCCVTSPPYYGLRDYGTEGQYGLEESPAAYVETMRALFAEVRRVLADDGTLWLNIGDSYGRGSRPLEQPPQTVESGGRYERPKIPRPDGKRSLNLPPKNLMGIPWRVAFALQDDGWILRNEIIWHKTNGMPESVTDRLTSKHEHLFMLTKQPRYWFDLDPIRETLATSRPDALSWDREEQGVPGQKPQHRQGRTWEERKQSGEPVRYGLNGQSAVGVGGFAPDERGRNPGDVWSIPTQPYPGAHFAVMPQTLASRAIQAGCKPAGTVLDPFSGSGTTGLAAAKHGRKYVGIDLNSEYLDLSLKTRLAQPALMDEA